MSPRTNRRSQRKRYTRRSKQTSRNTTGISSNYDNENPNQSGITQTQTTLESKIILIPIYLRTLIILLLITLLLHLVILIYHIDIATEQIKTIALINRRILMPQIVVATNQHATTHSENQRQWKQYKKTKGNKQYE